MKWDDDASVQRIIMSDEGFLIINLKPWRTFPGTLSNSFEPSIFPVAQHHSNAGWARDAKTKLFSHSAAEMFVKEIMFVIFISTEKAVRSSQDHGKSGRQSPWRPSPFCFSMSIRLLEVVQKKSRTRKHCNFAFRLSLSLVCRNFQFHMIIECGACLGLKLKYFYFENYFPVYFHPQQALPTIFPSFERSKHMSIKLQLRTKNVISKNFHLNQSFHRSSSSCKRETLNRLVREWEVQML